MDEAVRRREHRASRLAVGSASIWFAAAVGGCARPSPCPATPSTVTPPAATREHCLAAPWVVGADQQLSGLPRWSAFTCTKSDGWRAVAFVHEGTRPITSAEQETIQRALSSKGLTNHGRGACCPTEGRTEPDLLCISIWLGACEARMTEIVERVDAALAEKGLGAVRVGIDIRIGGAIKPRCETCGPLASFRWSAPRPRSTGQCEARRVPVPPAALTQGTEPLTSGGRCAHDGECAIRSCGRRCVPWNADPAGAEWCDVTWGPKEAYCGCVADQCAWFRVPTN